MKRLMFLFACYFSFLFSLMAQIPNLKKLDLIIGSNSSVVSKIEIDQEGYLWYLTNNDLFRFNGSSSEGMNRFLKNIETARLIDIKINKNGIYLITDKEIFSLYTSTWKTKEILQLNADEEILKITYNKPKDVLYIGTNQNNLFIIKNEVVQKQISLYDSFPEQKKNLRINKLNHYDNELYVSCENGLVIKFNSESFEKKTYQLPTNKAINSCFKINGKVYAKVFEEGIFEINTFTKFDHIPDIFFKTAHILQVKNDELWGLSKNHSFKLVDQKKTNIDIQIPGHLSDAIIEDDFIFLSTGLGVYNLNLHGEVLSHQSIPENFSVKSTRNIHFTNEGLWLSTYSGSIFSTSDSLYYYKEISYAVEPLNDSTLALGTEGQGIQFFNIRSKKIDEATEINQSLPKYIKSLCKRNNELLIGTNRGLFVYSLENGQISFIQNTNNLVINKLSKSDEDIFVSTDRGFFKFEDRELKRIVAENMNVKSHLITPTNYILATMHNGIVIIAKEDEQNKTFINTTNYLKTNTIYDLVEFKKMIYAFTEKGIYVFDEKIEKPVVNFAGEFEFNHNSIYQNATDLYAGHLEGWSKINFEPTNLNFKTDNTLKLSAYNLFTKTRSDKKLLNKNKNEFELRLPSQTNAIGFEFAINPNYINNRQEIYFYNLSSINDQWVSFTNQEGLIIANLSPRWNEIRVKKNLWDSEETSINIYKEPYFYETFWFKLLIFIGLCILIYSIIYYNNYVNKIQNDIKEKISKDLHDEVGSQLSTISLQTEFIKLNNNTNLHDKYLKSIAHTSKEAIRSLNHIVWSLQNNSIYWKDYLELLQQYSMSFFELTQTKVEFINNTQLKKQKIDKRLNHNLLMIYKEMLNNILKHAEATKVTIQVEQINNLLKIQIKDNGKGFNLEKNKSTGNGIKNIINRSKQENIKIEINTALKQGSLYYLALNL
ncbi:sensor histidine kinase [Psychroflexus maritimus]|uniref:histidine kinase n=1 Tax=Psychroflexus maritimus TaxID=2714865 RepID=A0A967AKY6_9FLAO|nr:histidine kinase [Psychroflexus maritimus]NGZ90209.1 hypothetical protein [Psychroflexus maritimus]